MGEDVGRTVVGGRVVPLRVSSQVVGVMEIFEEEPARPIGPCGRVKQVHILTSPIIGAEPDQVAFIGQNVKQFVLTEKATYCGMPSPISSRVSMDAAT